MFSVINRDRNDKGQKFLFTGNPYQTIALNTVTHTHTCTHAKLYFNLLNLACPNLKIRWKNGSFGDKTKKYGYRGSIDSNNMSSHAIEH